MGDRVKIQKSKPPETKTILAKAVVDISKSMKGLLKSGLNKRAIIILVQAETRLNRCDIESVMDAMTQLEGWYCK